MRILRLGTRKSPLALRQAEEIRKLYPGLGFELIGYETPGDRDKLTPISGIEGSDFFTRDLDKALLGEEIDLAVHSSKDLPVKLAKGLYVALETDSLSPFDCLVSRNDLKIDELPKGSRIGTSSIRRKAQIRLIRMDLRIADVRGNIEERLKLIDSGVIDALIVAQAALIRLGLEKRVVQILDIFGTHPKQGRLSVVVKEERWQEVRSILSGQDPVTQN